MIMHTRQLRTRTCRRATRHFFIPYEAFSCSSSHSSAGNTFLGKREREMLGLGPMLARREAAGAYGCHAFFLSPHSEKWSVAVGRSVGRSRRPKTPLARSRSGDEQFILYLISSDRSRRRRRRRRLARECLPACLCLCDGTVWLERGRGEKWEVGERGRRGLAAALTHSGRSR